MIDDKNAKILIAGYKGLVGSSILTKLKELNYTNLIPISKDDADLRNQQEVESLFKVHHPEYVFIAAAKVGGILANDTYKGEFLYDNAAIALNMIHTSYRYKVKKLLNLGSSCIYPKEAPQPLKEEFLLTGPLEPTNEPYAIAKILAIKLCRYYNEQFGTNFISVMPTNLYGGNDNFNLETSHVLPALIRKILLAKAFQEDDFQFIINDIKKNIIGFDLDNIFNAADPISVKDVLSRVGIHENSIDLWGTGKVRREFLDADSMAEACVFLMENYDAKDIGEFVNIGTGKDITISELVDLIIKITGYQGNVNFKSDKPDGTKRKLLDVKRINKLGWKASASLEDGIAKVIKFYKATVINA